MCDGHRFLDLQATLATGGPRTWASRIGGGQIMIGGAAAVAIGGIGGATSGAAGAGAAAEAATSTCEFCSEEVAQPRGFPDKQHTVDRR